MSFFFLSVGCLFLLSSTGYLAYLANIPVLYVVGSSLVLLSLAIFTSMHTARRSRV